MNTIKIQDNEDIIAFIVAVVLFIGLDIFVYHILDFEYYWYSSFIIFIVSFGIGFVVLNALLDKDIKELFRFGKKAEEEKEEKKEHE